MKTDRFTMVSSKFIALAIFSCMAPALAAENVTLYSEEPCTGETALIQPNNKCTLVPEALAGKVVGVKVPEDIVCNFYKDEKCKEPILYSVEDPGICTFSEWDTDDQKVSNLSASVLCFDSTVEES
ncbi:hypothetical protein BDV37DRAFT_253041 [Aspergillus pseudonomiae]|uniref:Uncharacterized protein n=1 Tax=Aspergillus pseudonomiae TaxID=1506151 RepID=A0A5N7D7M7_9EURO|nr:uncharacterized protein BDV37DRAFT_253041 [Aspergillus pseudonomiae]KAE8402205.1 hypothetical protein BDV37DRAFT_253041 [Aspergillus pseudonomiae]